MKNIEIAQNVVKTLKETYNNLCNIRTDNNAMIFSDEARLIGNAWKSIEKAIDRYNALNKED